MTEGFTFTDSPDGWALGTGWVLAPSPFASSPVEILASPGGLYRLDFDLHEGAGQVAWSDVARAALGGLVGGQEIEVLSVTGLDHQRPDRRMMLVQVSPTPDDPPA